MKGIRLSHQQTNIKRGEVYVSAQKFTDMRSVSLTVQQGAALDKQASKEGRKAGNLIRLAICKYLEEAGALPVQINAGEASDEDEEEE